MIFLLFNATTQLQRHIYPKDTCVWLNYRGGFSFDAKLAVILLVYHPTLFFWPL